MLEMHPDEFHDTINGVFVDAPVIIYVTATWCGPCRVLGPVMQQVSDETNGKAAVIAKMDADRCSDLVKTLGIRGVPTIIVYRHGSEVARHTGVLTKAKIYELAGLTLPAPAPAV